MSDPDKKPESKWAQYAKFVTSVAALLTALVTALIALQETKNKAPEKASKAAHNELVSKLEALDKDMEALEKKYRKHLALLEKQIRVGVSTAQADADAVRALFTGYALAARGKSAVAMRDIKKEIKVVVKEAQKRTEDVVKASPVQKPIKRAPRRYKKAKSWDKIQKQLKGGGDKAAE